MKTLEDFKKEAFKRPGVRKAYEEMQPEGIKKECLKGNWLKK